MNRNVHVVVVGAGVTGLALATLLTKCENAQSLRISIVDAAKRPRWDVNDDIALRVSALSAGSAELLDRIGAWRAIEASRLCPYDHMRVWDAADEPTSPTTLSFDADEFAVPHLGYIVENVLVRHALLDALDHASVDVLFDSPIEHIDLDSNSRRVELQSGQQLDADLVIGADGARSVVRESAGIKVRRWPYAQKAFVTHLRPELDHEQTAWQRFLRDGPLGILPLADGRVSVVWSTTPDEADKASQIGDRQLGAMLTEASDNVLGQLEVNGARGAFSLAAQHAEFYVARGMALIGDAAHTVHPLAGQGANLGLQDAAELASVIDAALSKGEHPGDRPVLRRYERARKGANATMLHFVTGLNQLFASDSLLLGELRRTGMQLFNRSGPVRKRVVGVALGANRR